MSEDSKEINLLIKSRYPLLYVESSEEERVIHDLLLEMKSDDKAVMLWDLARGITLATLTDNMEYIEYVTLDKQKFQRMIHPTDEPSSFKCFEGGGEDIVRNMVDNAPFKLFSDAITIFKYLVKPTVFLILDGHSVIGTKDRGFIYEHVRLIKDVCLAISSTGKQGKYMKTIAVLSPVVAIPDELDKMTNVISYHIPDAHGLRILLDRILTQHKKTVEKKAPELSLRLNLTENEKYAVIRAGLGLTQNEFLYAINYSFGKYYAQPGSPIRPSVIQKIKEGIVRKAKLLEFINPIDINSVGGLATIKQAMEENKWALTAPAKKLGAAVDKGILLVGIAGTGKSLIVKASAAVLGLNVLRMDSSAIYEGLVGSSERNMKRALDIAAANAPCILWMDEIEKLMAGLESSGRSDAGTTAKVFGILLTFMQECEAEILVIATCNDMSSLPDALLRRFEKIYCVDLPARKAREEIIRIHLTKKRGSEHEVIDITKFNIEALVKASYKYTGAEIEIAIKRAIKSGGIRKGTFTTEDVLREIKKIVPLAVRSEKEIKDFREKMRGKVEWADEDTIENEVINGAETERTAGIELP